MPYAWEQNTFFEDPSTGAASDFDSMSLKLGESYGFSRPGRLDQEILGAQDYSPEAQAQAYAQLDPLDKFRISVAQNSKRMGEEEAINASWDSVFGVTDPKKEDRISFYSRMNPDFGEDFIRENLPAIELQLAKGDTRDLVKNYPELAALAQDPEYLRRAQGDMNAYKRLYSIIHGQRDSVVEQSAGRLGRFGREAATVALGCAEFILDSYDYAVDAPVQRQAAEYLRDVTSELKTGGYHSDARFNEWYENMMVSLVGAVPSVAISLGSAVLGHPEVGIAYISGASGATLYDDLRSNGVDYTTAAPVAVTVGVLEGYIEKFTLGKISPTTILDKTLRGAGKEALEGGLQESLQSAMSTFGRSFAINEQMYDDGKISAVDVMTNAFTETGEAYQDIIAEGGAGALVSMIISAPGVIKGVHAAHTANTEMKRMNALAKLVQEEGLSDKETTYGDTMDAIDPNGYTEIRVDQVEAIAQGNLDEYASMLERMGVSKADADRASRSIRGTIKVKNSDLVKKGVWDNAGIDSIKKYMSINGAPSNVDSRVDLEDGMRRLAKMFGAVRDVSEVDAQDMQAVDLVYENLSLALRDAGYTNEQAKMVTTIMREGDARVARVKGESQLDYLNRVSLVVAGAKSQVMFGRDIVSVPKAYVGDVELAKAIGELDMLEGQAKQAEDAGDYTRAEEIRTAIDAANVRIGRMSINSERNAARRTAVVKRAGELATDRITQVAKEHGGSVVSATYDEENGTTRVVLTDENGGEVVVNIGAKPFETSEETASIVLPVTEEGNVNIAPLAGALRPLDGKAAVKRGLTSVDDVRTVIRLATHSDYTSIIHEYMHVLRRQWAIAADEGSVDAMAWKDAFDIALMESFGADVTETQADEYFAQAFETYIREGKAPSAELVDAFAASREWMMQIHAAVGATTDAYALNSQYTDVFNSMFAADEATEMLEREVGVRQEELDKLDEEARAEVEDQVVDLDNDIAIETERLALRVHRALLKDGRAEDLKNTAKDRVNMLPEYKLLAAIGTPGLGFPQSSLATPSGVQAFRSKFGATSLVNDADVDYEVLRQMASDLGFTEKGRDPIDVALSALSDTPSYDSAVKAEYQRLLDADTEFVKGMATELTEGLALDHMEGLRDSTILLMMRINDLREGRRGKSNADYRVALQIDKETVRRRLATTPVGDLSVKDIDAQIKSTEREIETLRRQLAVGGEKVKGAERVQKLKDRQFDLTTKRMERDAARVESETAKRRKSVIEGRRLLRENKVRASKKLGELEAARITAEENAKEAVARVRDEVKVEEAERQESKSRRDALAARSKLMDAVFAEEAEVSRLLRTAELMQSKAVAAFQRTRSLELRAHQKSQQRAKAREIRETRRYNEQLTRAEKALAEEETAQAQDKFLEGRENLRKDQAKRDAEVRAAKREEVKQEKVNKFAEELAGREQTLTQKTEALDAARARLRQLKVARSETAKVLKQLASRKKAITKAIAQGKVPGTKNARIGDNAQRILKDLAVVTGLSDFGHAQSLARALASPMAARDFTGSFYRVRVDTWDRMTDIERRAYITQDYGTPIGAQGLRGPVNVNVLADRESGRVTEGKRLTVDQLLPSFNETIPEWMANMLSNAEAVPFDSLPVDFAKQYLSVMEAIDHLSAGRLATDRANKAATIFTKATEGIAHTRSVRKNPREEWNTRVWWQRMTSYITKSLGMMSSLREFADLEGGLLVEWDKQLATAEAKQRVMADRIRKEFMGHIQPVIDKLQKALDAGVRDGTWIHRHPDMITLAGRPTWDANEVISVLLNMGNIGNRQAIMEGNLKLTAEDIAKMSSLLSDSDLRSIQKAGDVISQMWYGLNETSNAMYGGGVPRVAGDKVSFKNSDGGTTVLDGWYYPLKYDALLDPRVKKNEENKTTYERWVDAGIHTTVLPGSFFARKEGMSFTPLLDIDRVTLTHIDSVSRFITHGKEMYDISRIMDAPIEDTDADGVATDTSLRREWERTYGVDWVKKLQMSLNYIAHPKRDVIAGDRTAAVIRNTLTSLALGYRFTTGVLQRLSTIPAMNSIAQETGLGVAEAFTISMQAALDLSGNFFYAQQEIIDAIGGESVYMQSRLGETGNREIEAARKHRAYGTGKVSNILQSAQDYGYVFIQMNDRATVCHVYATAKMAARKAGQSVDEAIETAVRVVRNTQPSTSATDMALILQQPGVLRLLTYFLTYKARATGRTLNAFNKMNQGDITKFQLAQQLAVETMLPAMVLLGATALKNAVLGDDDGEEKTYVQLAGEIVMAPVYDFASGLPLIRNVASAVKFERMDYALPAPLSIPYRNMLPLYYGYKGGWDNYENEDLFFDTMKVPELILGNPIPTRVHGLYEEIKKLSD